MNILIVDDSRTVTAAIESILSKAGYTNLHFAETGQECFQRLGIANYDKDSVGQHEGMDLVLLDIVLPDLDGREVCRVVKSVAHLRDIPIIMVTALGKMEDLAMAFDAGAMDYITKPINSTELLVRIRSALKLKQEIDKRKQREAKLLEVTKQLKEAVNKLNRLSTIDGLTSVANRRRFDEYLKQECGRAQRKKSPLSMVLMDIDFFKPYNDTYGHQAGDECLQKVARAIEATLHRSSDLLCRYGGEEFAAVLPETSARGAKELAETMRASIESLRIEHVNSRVSAYVTISAGVACAFVDSQSPQAAASLIAAADSALYQAKKDGRNRVKLA